MNESQNVELAPWPLGGFSYHFAHQLPQGDPALPENPHIHDCYELYINVSGDVDFLVNHRLYPVEPGDVIVTRPGDVHLCLSRDPEDHERFCLWLGCPADSPLVAFTQGADFVNLIHFREDVRRELLRLLYRLKDAEASLREPARTAYLFRILTLFAEGPQTESETPALPEAMEQVLEYIHSGFTEVHCIEDIARATHISGSTLNRWFRKYLQLSPHKYVEALKLSHAQRLLLEGRSVTEVCSRSGFSDCSRFIRIFREKFGQTPLQYQKHRSL